MASPYISAAGLYDLARYIAGKDITISANTGDPGNGGTTNELSSAGARNYARKAVGNALWTVDNNTATADNTAIIELFTPSAESAGDTVTHIGYWYSMLDPNAPNNAAALRFFGSVPLRAGVTTVAGEPLRIAAGTADFTFSLASG